MASIYGVIWGHGNHLDCCIGPLLPEELPKKNIVWAQDSCTFLRTILKEVGIIAYCCMGPLLQPKNTADGL